MPEFADNMRRAVSLLDEAAARKAPIAPIRNLIGTDVAMAYAVQDELTAMRRARGARVVGRKIGLTSPAVQQQLGVEQPDFGVLFDDMEYGGGDTVPTSLLMQPKVEAEIAFVLAQDLDTDVIDIATVRNAIAYAVAALEIVDSRITDWDITIVDTIADNASSGLYVLGPRRLRLDEFEPKNVRMSMSVDGVVTSQGSGEDCLGDPLEAVVWLARVAKERGNPLRAGHVVLSGALGPMVTVTSGNEVRADISTLGSVLVRFADTHDDQA